MEGLVKGDVVVVPFPFTDLSSFKKRPAVVTAILENKDLILCPITSSKRNDSYDIELNLHNFSKGRLNNASSIRPNRVFTADKKIIFYKVGSLKEPKIKEVENKIVEIFTK